MLKRHKEIAQLLDIPRVITHQVQSTPPPYIPRLDPRVINHLPVFVAPQNAHLPNELLPRWIEGKKFKFVSINFRDFGTVLISSGNPVNLATNTPG